MGKKGKRRTMTQEDTPVTETKEFANSDGKEGWQKYNFDSDSLRDSQEHEGPPNLETADAESKEKRGVNVSCARGQGGAVSARFRAGAVEQA